MKLDHRPPIGIPLEPAALPQPRSFRPGIGLIGCGNITTSHLTAYRDAGWDTVALCDLREAVARQRATDHAPGARVYTNYQELLADTAVEVVDIALHAEYRAPVIEDALRSGHAVLSQKPFVLDLKTGRRLVNIAETENRRLAVNQNARWAPYVRYLHQICAERVLGEIQTVQIHIHWDHTWIRGMDFEKIHHIVLFDFGIHWFDMTRLFFGSQPVESVFAQVRASAHPTVNPPLIASATVGFTNGCASLLFDGNASRGARESITITGTKGVVHATGDLHRAHDVELITDQGSFRPSIPGHWYNDGFRGAMGELLCSLEDSREPANSAADQLETLELVFAAIESADCGRCLRPGEVTAVGDRCRIAAAAAVP